jgi:hypothetical protein
LNQKEKTQWITNWAGLPEIKVNEQKLRRNVAEAELQHGNIK